jgi:hypothetical protein
MSAKTSHRQRKRPEPAEPDVLVSFRDALDSGEPWAEALLGAVAQWDIAEEQVEGRSYRYLIGGEAFDWLLLAERLCEEADGAIPPDEKEALLFFGRLPHDLDDEDFKRAIGPAKHRAHLNYVYGVAVEEALQLVVEQEVLKERRAYVWDEGVSRSVEAEVYARLYSRDPQDMLAEFREERGLDQTEYISYGERREFLYWLSKFRVNQSDPARVASDTRRALAQLSELQEASRRRASQRGAVSVEEDVVEGEVVAHLR